MKQNLLRHIIIGLLLAIAVSSYGQQDAMFTQYMNNPQLINPAYAGSQGSLNFNGIFRDQWVGIDGAPTSTSFSVNGPFKIYQVGLGFDFMHDQQGFLSQTSLFANYAYKLEFNNSATLSLGLKTGFNYIQKDFSGADPADPDRHLDAYPLQNRLRFNVGIGLYYYTDDYFIGASIPKMIKNSWVDSENTNELYGYQKQHIFLTAGYVFPIYDDLKFKPSMMLRMVEGSPLSAEATATAIFADRIWFGLMYRWGDGVAAHVRFEIQDGLQIGYSYDYTTSALQGVWNNGTHEIFFNYTIRKKGKRILSPRYF